MRKLLRALGFKTKPKDQAVYAVLVEGKRRILQGWTKSVYAEDLSGNSVASNSPEACKWCMVGAIGDDLNSDMKNKREAWRLLRDQIPENEPLMVEWNDKDSTTKDDVLKAFDGAIANA